MRTSRKLCSQENPASCCCRAVLLVKLAGCSSAPLQSYCAAGRCCRCSCCLLPLLPPLLLLLLPPLLSSCRVWMLSEVPTQAGTQVAAAAGSAVHTGASLAGERAQRLVLELNHLLLPIHLDDQRRHQQQEGCAGDPGRLARGPAGCQGASVEAAIPHARPRLLRTRFTLCVTEESCKIPHRCKLWQLRAAAFV